MLIDDKLIEKVRELNKNIIIKTAGPDDASAFTELVNLYGQRTKSNKYFEWLFLSCPYETKLFVAYDNNRLAGFFGCQIRELNNGVNVSLCTELLIHEQYRNSGLFFLLDKELSEYSKNNGSSAVFAIATYSGMKAYKGLGSWKLIGEVNTISVHSNDLKKLKEFSPPKNIKKNLIFFKKEDDYFKWRFDQHYNYKYEYLRSETKRKMVRKSFLDETTNEKFGDIVYYDQTLNDFDEIIYLFNESINEFSKEDISTVTTWALEHTLVYNILSSIGFRKNSQIRYFCGKILNNENEYLLDINNWNLVQADSEIF